ncbi:MAG: CCA tRNA nucleotidyltransferase [Clostridiales bacterium]|nr:CCA tRNA nucleotidyltransferase [Clostridiales bacterium]
MGYVSDDIDICSSASPQKVRGIFSSYTDIEIMDVSLPLGTLIIRVGNQTFEYTSFRRESYRQDGTHTPTKVHLDATIKQDSLRRDFTVNALYYDLQNEKLIDMFDGVSDIENKTLRTTRNVQDVFCEDALRILRMCRICAQTMLAPSEETLIAAKSLSSQLCNLSKERIVQEIHKLLTANMQYPNSSHDNIVHGINLLFSSGVSDVLLPNTKQDIAIKAASASSMSVKIALLILDTTDKAASLDYLCLNNDAKKDALFLLNHTHFDDCDSLDFLSTFGYEKGLLLVEFLTILDKKSSTLKSYLKNMKTQDSFISIDTLRLSGEDIMQTLHIPSSPIIGEIKKELFKHVVQHPEDNTRKQLISYILKNHTQ